MLIGAFPRGRQRSSFSRQFGFWYFPAILPIRHRYRLPQGKIKRAHSASTPKGAPSRAELEAGLVVKTRLRFWLASTLLPAHRQ
jgi:hypothetical protein